MSEILPQINNVAVNESTAMDMNTTDLQLETGILNEPTIKAPNLTQIGEVQRDQDILDFLAKPIFLQSVTVDTTDARNATLWALQPAQTIVGGAAYPQWVTKLAGFYTFKGTFVYDVIVNATPFHAGAFLMAFRPCEETSPGLYAARNRDLNGTSQLPGAIICNYNKNHYTIKIPYIAPTEMFDLHTTDTRFPSWGIMRGVVWSPLAVGAAGSNSITLSLYGHWEDVVLGGSYTQSAGRRKKVSVSKISAPAQEQSSANPFSLSHSLSTISESAGTLSKIPALSGVAGAASWAAGVASDIAQYFGFAKPLTDSAVIRVFHMLGQYANNGSGTDDSIVQATNHDASLSIIDQKTIYDADEMSLDFIKTRPAYLKNLTYSATNAVDDQLDKFDCIPIDFFTSVPYDTITLKQYTPVGLLAKCFYQYTGGFKIKIKFFKTAFHAGTLAFTFVPGVDVAATYGLDDTTTANRYIVDIQTTDEIVLTLPWQIPYPNDYVWFNMGSLYVHCVTPLRAPETVSQSIDITYEILGGDDLTFFNPMTLVPNPVCCQGATDETNKTESIHIGLSKDLPDVTLIAQDCIGEQIKSIKQFVNRFTQMNTSIDFTGANSIIWVAPFATGSTAWVSATHSAAYPEANGSWMDFWSMFYLFKRGSVRWRMFRASSPNDGFIVKEFNPLSSNHMISNISDTTTSIEKSDSNVGNSKIAYTFFPKEHNSVSVQVPMQNITSVIPNDPWLSVGSNPRVCQPTIGLSFKSGSTADDLYITRSGGDDFQFLFWLGVPLCSDAYL